MRRNRLILLFTILVSFALILLYAGCSKIQNRKLDVSELGLTMDLPGGWQVDSMDKRMFTDTSNPNDNFGLVEDYPLEGKTLDEYMKNELKSAFQTKIVSQTSRTLSGYNAIEVVTEAEYKVIEVDIQKEKRVIRVSFRTLRDDFSKWESEFRKSLDSIRIQ